MTTIAKNEREKRLYGVSFYFFFAFIYPAYTGFGKYDIESPKKKKERLNRNRVLACRLSFGTILQVINFSLVKLNSLTRQSMHTFGSKSSIMIYTLFFDALLSIKQNWQGSIKKERTRKRTYL